MKRLLFLLVAVACGGPSQQQLAETPSARTIPPAKEPPPGNQSDLYRDRLRQSFDDMETTQRAYREAGQGAGSGSAGAPRGKHLEYPPNEPPPKKGPAVEAPKTEEPTP